MNMRKILRALAAAATLFALAACDNGSGGSGGGGDPFDDVEQTLTETVTSADGFDFVGDWDYRFVFSEYTEGYGTMEEVTVALLAVTADSAVLTVTAYHKKYICDTPEVYEEMKARELDGFTASAVEGSRTVTFTATDEYIEENEPPQTMGYDDFVESLQIQIDGGAEVTTNSSKTAISVSVKAEHAGRTMTTTMVKR